MTKRVGRLTKALRVDVIDAAEDAWRLTDEWDALARLGGASPFALPALALPWWRHLGKGALRIVTARSATGELVGLAPFHERRLGRLPVLRPLGHGVGAIATTLVAPVKADVAGLLAGGLLDGDGAVLHAADMTLTDPLFGAERYKDSRAVHATLHDECPTVDLAGIGGSHDLLARPSHARLRKQLARADRALAGRSAVVEVAESPAEVGAAFGAVAELFDAAEADRPRLHLGRGAHGAFFAEALDALARRRQVAFLTLRIDGSPAAFDVYVVCGTVAAAVLGRYHPEMAEWSPGHLLLRAGVDWAGKAGMAVIDLQLGSDRYKTAWSTGSTDTFTVMMGTPGRLAAARPLLVTVESAHRFRAAVGRLRPPAPRGRRIHPPAG